MANRALEDAALGNIVFTPRFYEQEWKRWLGILSIFFFALFTRLDHHLFVYIFF